jgi:hypothetical protein
MFLFEDDWDSKERKGKKKKRRVIERNGKCWVEI